VNDTGGRQALVVGATGLVGRSLLTRLTQHDSYEMIATLGRRAPDFRHERVSHHVVDFSGDWNLSAISRVDVLFCCLGTTIKQAGSQAAFRAIDFDLVVAIARQAFKSGTGTFVVVSSVGARADAGSFYPRTKGEMEQAVSSLGFKRLGILRPSLLLGARQDLRIAEQLGQHAARLFKPLMVGGLNRYRAVDARTVADSMIGFDLSDAAGVCIIEGKEIRRLAQS